MFASSSLMLCQNHDRLAEIVIHNAAVVAAVQGSNEVALALVVVFDQMLVVVLRSSRLNVVVVVVVVAIVIAIAIRTVIDGREMKDAAEMGVPVAPSREVAWRIVAALAAAGAIKTFSSVTVA